MRTSLLISLVLSGLAFVGCAKDKPSDTLPKPPEFEAASADSPEATPTPASEGRDSQIAPEDQVQFGLDSAVLDAPSMKVLNDISMWVKGDPARSILVKGHADATGSEAHNFELSSRRAAAVADYLTSHGVPREQIAVVAVGEDDAVLQPVQSNRRVVIYAITTGPVAAR